MYERPNTSTILKVVREYDTPILIIFNAINICDWIYENNPKLYISYFEKYQFEIFKTL